MVCFHGRSIVRRPYHVRVLLERPSAQSPFARARCYLSRRDLLDHVSRYYPRLHRSYGLMRPSSPPLRASVLPSDTKSLQVAVSPCWEEDLPDVVSAHPSLRAWTSTPAAPQVLMPVSSLRTSAFPPFGPGRRSTMSVQRLPYGALFEAVVISSCAG